MLLTTEFDTTTLPTNLQTVDEFEAWERQYPHEGNYEFVQGRIIPKQAMKQDEFTIFRFLTRQFAQTAVFQQDHILVSEGDSYVDGRRKRIPDLAYFTADQIISIQEGKRVSTLFAIEILSDSESYDDVLEKLQDYFDGGTLLVWYIIPKRKKIYAYTSPDEAKAYKGTDVISAGPVLPELSFSVEALFA